jgi:hypothetical protein
VTLACYRLARYFHQHPDTFLNQPLSVISRHLYWTDVLLEQAAKAREAEDDYG